MLSIYSTKIRGIETENLHFLVRIERKRKSETFYPFCLILNNFMNLQLKLENIRNVLIRQEETIIFSLVERAQFCQNENIYQKEGIPIPDFKGSFVDYLLFGTETLHATVRRYTSPDEHPFSNNLPGPIVSPVDFNEPIKENKVNINSRIKEVYEQKIIPAICAPGDDEQYGSSAVCDVNCLQALSKRIHYGKFVAESKFLSEKETFSKLIEAGAKEELRKKITNSEVEEKLLVRVEKKAEAYGQEVGSTSGEYKLQPVFVAELYKKWIIPLTKDVEVEYLLQRM